ncbi:hypothetical protein, partial [Ligilactobacillus equi]|uniref:hypothetical protein n=1 Tax=Ligilactobacillus equi TaxID=137357 RepID=UPI0013780E78
RRGMIVLDLKKWEIKAKELGKISQNEVVLLANNLRNGTFGLFLKDSIAQDFLKKSGNSSALPSYWENYLDSKIPEIQEKLATKSANSVA